MLIQQHVKLQLQGEQSKDIIEDGLVFRLNGKHHENANYEVRVIK